MPSKIKLCHMQLLPLMSGIQRITLQIFDVLDRDRFEPHVVLCGPGPFSEELEARGAICHFVPNLVRPIHPLRDVAAYRDLKQLCAHERFDIVHTHCSKPGILGRIAAKKAGVPHVIHHVQSFAFHEFTRALMRKIYVACERKAAPFGDRTIFVNRDDLRTAVDERIVPAVKCLLIPNGTDLSLFRPSFEPRGDSPLRRRLGVGIGGALIYFVARLEKPKQPLLLPDIAVALERLLPDADWNLIVAGEGGYREAVERKIAALRIGHRIRLVGFQTEAEKYATYHEADAVLQPSLWEGLSLTLIEAQAAGLPAVAGSVKGNRETVVPGTGYLCEPKNAADYARRLAELVQQPELRRSMGIAARRRAELEYDVVANMRRITQLYDEMLGEAASGASAGEATQFQRRAA